VGTSQRSHANTAVYQCTVESTWVDGGANLVLSEVTGTPAFSYDSSNPMYRMTGPIGTLRWSVRRQSRHIVWVQQYNLIPPIGNDLLEIPSTQTRDDILR